ncbi:MAG: hypothetical protein SP1CHLAM54_12930 [Chlamydiia bacterium]|nr:hypothetical protein [Chlamydiia bacterium]MCH9616189.1 hypothetical protein [Chlamydiia bacterium]MCH9629825.1 hypothetical protein [Chlamydiia bacterium]
MKEHPFLGGAGHWLGEGKITLNMMEEELPFYTKWKVPLPDDLGRIECSQEIQISGLNDLMLNEFAFYDIKNGKFTIELENQSLGKVVGSGIITPEKIAWEFRLNNLGFEGFEFYEKVDDNNYKLHAEYSTNDEFRTVIHGRIWKKVDTDSSF